MTKKELAALVADKFELPQAAAERVVDFTFNKIRSTLVKTGRRALIFGFGTFVVAESKARIGRNPKTGETMQLPASRRLRFKMSKELKSALASAPKRKLSDS